MKGEARRRPVATGTAKGVGFVAGTALGGGLFGAIGYRVFVLQSNLGYRPVGSLAFFVLFMLGIFALAAPFTLGKFFGARLRTQVAEDVVYAASFVVAFAFLGGVTLVALYALSVYGVSDPFGFFVVFDTVTGATLGGIAGYTATDRLVA